MSIKFTPNGFALWVLSTIAEPEYTDDSGVTAKRRAIELMEAAGLAKFHAEQLLQEWLDKPQPEDCIADKDSPLVQAMAVGARKLLVKEEK